MSVPFSHDTLKSVEREALLLWAVLLRSRATPDFTAEPPETCSRSLQEVTRRFPCTHAGSEASGNQEESSVRKVPSGQQILSGARFLRLDLEKCGTSETARRKAHLHKRRRGIFPAPSLRNVREGGRQRWNYLLHSRRGMHSPVLAGGRGVV